MNELIIKDVLVDKSVEHIANVVFFDSIQKMEFTARLDLRKLWFLDPVRFEQDQTINQKIAALAH